MTDPEYGPDRLADLLVEDGALTDPAWEAAVRAVRRHEFLPEVVWVRDDDGWRTPYGRDTPQWRNAVYADYALVTQVDDGRPAGPDGRGRYPTSSASQPSLVVAMLQALDVAEGHRVLEIGTGTGYNTALLCHRLGDENVTSIEVDETVARQAAANLKAAGYAPRLVVGDGAEPVDGGPFDRVIATVGAKRIPRAWVSRLRPGGRLVVPWGSDFGGHWLVTLTADGNGAVHGRLDGIEAAFMWLRDQRSHKGEWSDHIDFDAKMRDAVTALDPRMVHVEEGGGAGVVLGALVPDLYQITAWPKDAEGRPIRSGRCTVWVYDARGSWGAATYLPDADSYGVSTYGPRDLWAEIGAAWRAWQRAGRPGRERLGLTVTPSGEHRLWADEPGSVLTP
ncbi:ATP-grasp peptide maturase system methyltransferase [Marinactinospora endophytica]